MQTDITTRSIEMRNEYIREWRRNNKERVRAYNKRYWEKKAMREAAENHAEETE